MQYELFYLIGASKENEMPQIKEGVEKIIAENGGKFQEKETVEKRRLSYRIGRETHGIYIARRFDLENVESLKEMNRKLNLDGGVMRFILSRTDELPELKSKEERIAESSQKRTAPVKRDKPAVEKVAEIKKEKEVAEDKKEEKEKSEDIDKKLEEILNI